MIHNVKMYGFKGTVEKISETSFSVKIDNKEIEVEVKERWNDGFEVTPYEVAFTMALDEINGSNKEGNYLKTESLKKGKRPKKINLS